MVGNWRGTCREKSAGAGKAGVPWCKSTGEYLFTVMIRLCGLAFLSRPEGSAYYMFLTASDPVARRPGVRIDSVGSNPHDQVLAGWLACLLFTPGPAEPQQ